MPSLEQNYLYLLLNIGAIAIPLISSFYPKAKFADQWKFAFPALIISGLFFIVWDIYFTKWGIWGFNEAYLTGIHLFTLPVEEWLFFLCIPYACLFTYFAFKYLFKKDPLEKVRNVLTFTLLLLSAAISFIYADKAYTLFTGVGLIIFSFTHLFILKSNYLGRFYFSYLIILIPFFLINGVLTGWGIEEQVVWYNNSENLNIRIGTIPLEDAFYGMLLIGLNVTIFEELQLRQAHKMTASLQSNTKN